MTSWTKDGSHSQVSDIEENFENEVLSIQKEYQQLITIIKETEYAPKFC